jgi:hypothetical protein
MTEAERVELEQTAEQIAQWARSAFQNAEKEPAGSFGRRFVEHGAMCHFNSWSILRKCLDASSPLPSAIPEEERS